MPEKSTWSELIIKPDRGIKEKGCHEDMVDIGNPLINEDSDPSIKHENKVPMHLIKILENPENWLRWSLNVSPDSEGRNIYAKVHQDPIKFRNIYQYFEFSIAVPKRRKR